MKPIGRLWSAATQILFKPLTMHVEPADKKMASTTLPSAIRATSLVLATTSATFAAPVVATKEYVDKHQALPGRHYCNSTHGYASADGQARTFIWRPEWLSLEKRRVAENPAYAKQLRDAAERALKHGPHSVVYKLAMPPSGNLHDYYSIGPYWWPSNGNLNGEPYLRRDGSVNPDSRSDKFDKNRMMRFSNDVRVLALAFHHLEDRRYAIYAAKLIRMWFVSRDTKMNPNLNHGQAIPGVNSGRGEGIIELNALSGVVESIGLIEPAGVLTGGDRASLKQWFTDLTHWMETSPNGIEERIKINNHGLHYDYLITHFALFAGREELARRVITDFTANRLSVQMAADGSFPEELSRTRSWHYTFYALEAATKLASLGECLSLDLWSATTEDGRGLAKAFKFVEPYHTDLTKWPHEEIGLADAAKRESLGQIAINPLRMMAWGTGDIIYEQHAARYDVNFSSTSDYWLPPMRGLSTNKNIPKE